MIMSDIKSTLTNLTKTVTKTSGGIIKATKLSIALANEESNLNAVYIDIGKKVHEIYAYGGTLGKVFDEKYINILELEKKIQTLRTELDTAKGTKTCPHCGKSVTRDSGFCPKCGKNMIDTPVAALSASSPLNNNEPAVPEITPATEIYTGNGKICAVCETENSANDKFCLSCGRLLK